MDNGRAWRMLPAAHADVPVLLIATEFGAASYAVHVTDLAHVWTERLERRGICMRAFQENTTIDPSYDNEQMTVFLGKLQAAIDGSDDDASLSLAAAADGDLALHTTSILPAGLPPLQWTMHLKKQPCTAIASDLVLPLVHDRAVHQRATARLVAALQDKDAVINKLADKLEAMGAGVESAFPTLAGSGGGGGSGARRKITRSDMERRVRGLARFDEGAFRKQMHRVEVDVDEDTTRVDKLVGEAFGSGNGLRCDEAATPRLATAPDLESWWQELGTGRGVPLKRTSTRQNDTTSASNSQKTPDGDEGGDDKNGDDAFQEPTPKRPPPVSASSPIKQDPPSPTPAANAKGGPGKIGRLGAIGKKAKAVSPPPAPDAPEAAEVDDDTASEADDPPPPLPKDEDDEPAPAVAARPKPAHGGLGRIGGKKEKARPPEPAPEAEPTPQPAPEPVQDEAEPAPEPEKVASPKKPGRTGLGRIGGGKSTTKEAQTDDSTEDDTGKRKAPQKEEAETKAPAPPPPKEDAAKRAEVMQKAMEKHAAPVRKKRKF